MAFVHWSGFGTGVEGRGKMAKNIEKRIWVWGFSHVILFVYMASQLIGVLRRQSWFHAGCVLFVSCLDADIV